MSRTQGNNPIRVKKQNETLIKEIIYKYGPISRTQIAEMLSLTPPTKRVKSAEETAAPWGAAQCRLISWQMPAM